MEQDMMEAYTQGFLAKCAALATYWLLEQYLKARRPEEEYKRAVLPFIDRMHEAARRNSQKPEDIVKEFEGKEPLKFIYDMDTARRALKDDNLDYKEVPYFEIEEGKFAYP